MAMIVLLVLETIAPTAALGRIISVKPGGLTRAGEGKRLWLEIFSVRHSQMMPGYYL